MQGRFSEACPVGFDDLVTGQEFERARNLPPAWLLDNVLLKVGLYYEGGSTGGRCSLRWLLSLRSAAAVQTSEGDPAGAARAGQTEPETH